MNTMREDLDKQLTMTSNATAVDRSSETSRSAFEEERQVLLNSMATQLTQVVEQMARANENLSWLPSKNKPVEDVATLWREAYANSRQIMNDEGGEATTADAEHEHSSLSAVYRENRL